MREMLFRGKRKYNGEWVYGYYAKYRNILDGAYTAILQYDECKGDVYSDGIVAVIPETVGQYTGLTDMNGKRIFEGDIVRFDYVDDEDNDAHEDFLIFFEKGAFRAQYLGNIKCAPNILDDIAIKEGCVVGNTWDNPELLEVKK